MSFGKRKRKKPRLKRCPACKGTLQCNVCKGRGEVRIVKGRQKGQCFERAIAKQLTDWTGFLCTRTPLSGGWNKTGDVTPKDPEIMASFPFNFELKNQESWTIPMLFRVTSLKTTPKAIKNWWQQCSGDAKSVGKIPMLVFTKANEPSFLMLRTKDFRTMVLNEVAGAYMLCGKFRIMLWDEFLKLPYKEVLRRLKGRK